MASLQSYKEVTDINTIPPDCRHAAHAMVYTKLDRKIIGLYSMKSAVMMQMRFDGTLGFVGGIVDDGETPEEACTRECCEELGITSSVLSVTKQHHLFTHYSDQTRYCLHFYAIEVPYSIYTEIETKALQSRDWGDEVMGIIRCPTYTLPNSLGLPAFLRHEFIGNARNQLLLGLEMTGLLTKDEIAQVVKTSEKINSVVTVKNSIYDENMELATATSS